MDFRELQAVYSERYDAFARERFAIRNRPRVSAYVCRVRVHTDGGDAPAAL